MTQLVCLLLGKLAFSQESILLSLHIYNSTICSCMNTVSESNLGASAICVEILDKRKICNILGPDMSSLITFPPTILDWLCLFYESVHGNCPDKFLSVVPRRHKLQHNSSLAARSHHFNVEIFYANSFFSSLWFSLQVCCLLANFDH